MRSTIRSLVVVTVLLAVCAPGPALGDPRPPVANADAYATGVGTVLAVDAPGLLANDTDPNGDPITVLLSGSTKPEHGTLVLNPDDGSFSYTPEADFEGADRFTYRATDGESASDPATVTLTVDDPPVARADSYVTGSDRTLHVAPRGVLANDTDPNAGDRLVAVLDPDPATGLHGTLELGDDGSLEYTPQAGFVGTDQFTYRASDGLRSSHPVAVSIVVDDRPVATNDAYTILHGRTLTVAGTQAGVLANDSDPNGDPTSAVLESDVTNGALVLTPDGTFTYSPNPGFAGNDSFTYHATDGMLNSPSATVAITVTDIRPTARDDGAFGPITAGQKLEMVGRGVLVNDTDPDLGDQENLQAVLDTVPSYGQLQLNGDGSFSYQPRPGTCNRTERFTYTATDGALVSEPATVRIGIQTPRPATRLILTTSATRAEYGRSVRLIAHLTRFSSAAAISIYGKPAGGTRTLLAGGQPDAHGNIDIRVRPRRRTVYEATSADNCFQRAASAARPVDVFPLVEGHMVGSFDSRGGFALYHVGGRPPLYRATVTPGHPRDPVRFVWQRWSDGQWKRYFASATPLHLKKNSSIDVYMTGGVVEGTRYRVKIVFLADRDHLARGAPWAHFLAVRSQAR